MTSEISSAPELIYYCEFDPENWDDRLEITFSNEHIIKVKAEFNKGDRVTDLYFDIKSKESSTSNSFFGENILNITSIVGKNGIGKSHVLRKIYSMPKRLENSFGNEVIVDSILNNTNIFCIYFNGQDYFLEKTKGRIEVKGEDPKDQSIKNSCRMFFYNIEPSPILKLEEDQKKLTERTLMTSHPLANLYELLVDESEILSKDFKKAFFIPSKVEITIYTQSSEFKGINEFLGDNGLVDDFVGYIRDRWFSSEQKHVFSIVILLSVINDMVRLDRSKNFIDGVKHFFTHKLYDEKKLEDIVSMQKKLIIEEKQISSEGDYWLDCLEYLTQYPLKFERNPSFSNLTPSFQTIPTEQFDETFYNFLKGYEYYAPRLAEFIKIDFGRFSSGQESILFQISSIIHHINHELRLDDERNKTLIFFIDEYEQNLHPEWARIYLRYLLDVFEEIKKKNDRLSFQIIITTHSPYLISDLPKENIRLIEKDKDTGKRNVSKPKHSFASNYYDILSDSFFLEDTIGEFAKQKINGWITELNELKESSDSDLEKLTRIDELKELINIVDDQFIRNKLLELAKDVRKTILKQADKDLRASLIDKEIEKLVEMKRKLNEENRQDD